MMTTHVRDYSVVDRYDAIVFYGDDDLPAKTKYKFPKERSPKQLYVLGLRQAEPFTRGRTFKKDAGIYNVTMSYR